MQERQHICELPNYLGYVLCSFPVYYLLTSQSYTQTQFLRKKAEKNTDFFFFNFVGLFKVCVTFVSI